MWAECGFFILKSWLYAVTIGLKKLRHGHRWGDSSKVNLEEVGCKFMNCVKLVQDLAKHWNNVNQQ